MNASQSLLDAPVPLQGARIRKNHGCPQDAVKEHSQNGLPPRVRGILARLRPRGADPDHFVRRRECCLAGCSRATSPTRSRWRSRTAHGPRVRRFALDPVAALPGFSKTANLSRDSPRHPGLSIRCTAHRLGCTAYSGRPRTRTWPPRRLSPRNESMRCPSPAKPDLDEPRACHQRCRVCARRFVLGSQQWCVRFECSRARERGLDPSL